MTIMRSILSILFLTALVSLLVSFVIGILIGFSSGESINNKENTLSVRDQRVKELFSVWDGSCRMLVESVKEDMKNPKSFEHVETKMFDLTKPNDPNGKIREAILVIMEYRGTNSFGGIVTENAIGLIDTKTWTFSRLSEKQFIEIMNTLAV